MPWDVRLDRPWRSTGGGGGPAAATFLDARTVVKQNTTSSNDLAADGYNWAQGNPMVVDSFGKILVFAQRENSGSKRHVPITSSDSGATWSDPARASMFDAAGEALLLRGAMVHDPVHDLFHVLWVLTQADGAVIYRQYRPTRDGSNNITTVTRVRGVQLEVGVGGMSFEFPTAIWVADGAQLVVGWSAANGAAGATKAEYRATRIVPVDGAADVVLANWAAPLNEAAGAGATDSLGSSGLAKYSCLAKSATAKDICFALGRAATGSVSGDLLAYYVEGAGSGTCYYNRFVWSAADNDWRGGPVTAVANDAGRRTVTAIQRAGADAGYSLKHQLLAKIAQDTFYNKAWTGLSTYKSNADGDTWSIVSVTLDGNDTLGTLIDVYVAGIANTDAARDMFVAGDLMYDADSDNLVVTYGTLPRHDAMMTTYRDGAVVHADYAVYTATPVDIPTVHDVRVGGQLMVLFRDFNVGARANPPTYTPPYAGYAVRVAVSAGVADQVDPVVSGFVVTELAPATLRANAGGVVLVEWDTDKASDGQVEYGLTSGFGLQTDLSAPVVPGHAVTVPNLLPDTSYWFRVVSRDAAGNLVVGPTTTLTTQWSPAALPAGVRPDLWLDWRISAIADRYAGAGLTAIADGAAIGAAGTGPIYNWTTLGDLMTQPTAAQRPTYQAGGVGGAPGSVHDGSNDNLIASAHAAALEYTADRWILAVVNYPSGNTTTFRRFIGAYDAGTNTERWAVAMNAPTAGKVGVFGDTKGSYQGTTLATLNDGLTHAYLWVRSGTAEDVYVDWALHDSFTGMANTAHTGIVRIFANGSGSAISPGGWVTIMTGPGVLTADQRAHLEAWVA